MNIGIWLFALFSRNLDKNYLFISWPFENDRKICLDTYGFPLKDEMDRKKKDADRISLKPIETKSSVFFFGLSSLYDPFEARLDYAV